MSIDKAHRAWVNVSDSERYRWIGEVGIVSCGGDSVMVASISGFGGYKARIVPEGKRQPSLMESNATEFEKAVWRIARGS